MPGMTGVELLGEINKHFNEIPPQRLILSGYSEDKDIKKAFQEYKLRNFIPKPWDYEQLKQVILESMINS